MDIMKVILLLVAVFWSQEWKSALSDSIIHIGKLLRFFPFLEKKMLLSVRLSERMVTRFSFNHSIAAGEFVFLTHRGSP